MQLHYPLNPTTGVEDPAQLPWTDGVPQTGQEGSYPPHAMCVEPMQELCNLLDQVGITKSSSDLFQITRAVRSGQLDFDPTDTGTADAMVAQVGLAHTQLIAGLPFTIIKGPNGNTGAAAPTLTITDLNGNNGLTGKVVKATGAALGRGDLPGGALLTMRCISPGVFALVSMLTLSDLQFNGSVIRVTDTAGASTSDLLVGTTTAPIFGYGLNHVYVFTQGASPNATSTPKGNVTNPAGMALGALTFVKSDGSALSPGDLPAGMQFLATLDPAGGRLRLTRSVPSDGPRNTVGNPTVYVDCNNGSDANTGATAATAFRTINGALAAAASYLNLAGKTLLVVLAVTGTYAGPVVAVPGIAASISPAPTVTATIAGFGCLSASNGGSLTVSGVTLLNQVTNTSGGSVATVTTSNGGSITLAGPVTFTSYGNFQVGAHLSAQPGGSIAISPNAALTVLAGYNNFMSAVGGNITFNNGSSVSLANGAVFPTFALAQGSGANISAYVGSVNFYGTNTGNGFTVTNQASIQTNGSNPSTFFPQKSSPSNVSTPNGSYT